MPRLERILTLVAGAAIVCALAAPAQAKQGWFVGGGVASLSAAGDLDGNTAFVAPTGEIIVAGKLGNGTGIVIDGGYGFNDYIGIELLIAATKHTATSTLVAKDSSTSVSTSLLGVRGSIPVIKDTLEVFARFGISGHTVKYSSYAINGASTGEATFTGSGVGYGVGAEWTPGHLGFGLGITQFNAKFDQAKGQTFTGTLPSELKETFTLVDFTILYHF